MHWITIIILGAAVNLDNMCIGMSYGMSGKRICKGYNFAIALINGTFALMACWIAKMISYTHIRTAILAGSTILITLGILTIVGGIRKRQQLISGEREKINIDDAKFGEIVMLGAALALNCLPAAFGVGLSEVSPLRLGISLGGFSFFFIAVGNWLGIKVKCCCTSGWKLDMLSGAALIVIAVWELLV